MTVLFLFVMLYFVKNSGQHNITWGLYNNDFVDDYSIVLNILEGDLNKEA